MRIKNKTFTALPIKYKYGQAFHIEGENQPVYKVTVHLDNFEDRYMKALNKVLGNSGRFPPRLHFDDLTGDIPFNSVLRQKLEGFYELKSPEDIERMIIELRASRYFEKRHMVYTAFLEGCARYMEKYDTPIFFCEDGGLKLFYEIDHEVLGRGYIYRMCEADPDTYAECYKLIIKSYFKNLCFYGFDPINNKSDADLPVIFEFRFKVYSEMIDWLYDDNRHFNYYSSCENDDFYCFTEKQENQDIMIPDMKFPDAETTPNLWEENGDLDPRASTYFFTGLIKLPDNFDKDRIVNDNRIFDYASLEVHRWCKYYNDQELYREYLKLIEQEKKIPQTKEEDYADTESDYEEEYSETDEDKVSSEEYDDYKLVKTCIDANVLPIDILPLKQEFIRSKYTYNPPKLYLNGYTKYDDLPRWPIFPAIYYHPRDVYSTDGSLEFLYYGFRSSSDYEYLAEDTYGIDYDNDYKAEIKTDKDFKHNDKLGNIRSLIYCLKRGRHDFDKIYYDDFKSDIESTLNMYREYAKDYDRDTLEEEKRNYSDYHYNDVSEHNINTFCRYIAALERMGEKEKAEAEEEFESFCHSNFTPEKEARMYALYNIRDVYPLILNPEAYKQ